MTQLHKVCDVISWINYYIYYNLKLKNINYLNAKLNILKYNIFIYIINKIYNILNNNAKNDATVDGRRQCLSSERIPLGNCGKINSTFLFSI